MCSRGPSRKWCDHPDRTPPTRLATLGSPPAAHGAGEEGGKEGCQEGGQALAQGGAPRAGRREDGPGASWHGKVFLLLRQRRGRRFGGIAGQLALPGACAHGTHSPQHTCIARASPPRTLGDSQEDPLSSSATGSPAWPLYMPSTVSQCRSCVPALPISCPMIRLFRMPRLGVQRSQIPARLRDRQVQQQEQGQHHSVGGGRCLMDWAAWIKSSRDVSLVRNLHLQWFLVQCRAHGFSQ